MSFSREQIALLYAGYKKEQKKGYRFEQEWDGDTEPFGEAIEGLWIILKSIPKDGKVQVGKSKYDFPDLLAKVWNLCVPTVDKCDLDGLDPRDAPFLKKYEEGDLKGKLPEMPNLPVIAMSQIFHFASRLQDF